MSNKLRNREKKQESPWSACREFSGSLLGGMISIYMLLVIVVMPFYNCDGYSYIGTDKANFFRQISTVGTIFIVPVLILYLTFAWVERHTTGKRTCKIKWSVTDKFALAYAVCVVVSYLCSDYKESALWGVSGWFMGLFPQLIAVAIYFLISRFWNKENWMVWLFLPVSAIVFVLGYLNRFGIFPIDMKVQNSMFVSTIGNINWYCGYLVTVFFGGIYLMWKSDELQLQARWKRILLMLYVAIGYASLVTQGSMSGMVALAVMLIVLFCLSVNSGSKMKLFWQEVLLLCGACLFTLCVRTVFGLKSNYPDAVVDILTHSLFPVIATILALVFYAGVSYSVARGKYPRRAFVVLASIVGIGTVAGIAILTVMIAVNTLNPGSLEKLSEYSIFTFTPDWGSNRGATWKAGIMCFAEQDSLHKLVGAGPDCMEPFLYQSGSEDLVQLVRERFGTDRLTNAHNEWITVLVNIGLLGCVSYVGMMVSGIVRFLRCGRNVVRNGKNANLSSVIVGACGFSLLAYTVNNMFSFQQSMSIATIFVIFGIGEAYARSIRLI